MMLICLVECTGTFTIDRHWSAAENLNKSFYIFGNTIRITKGHYIIYITQHIRQIFTKFNIHGLLSKSIEKIIKCKVQNFTLRPCNIHYKQTLNQNSQIITKDLLPTIRSQFKIDEIETTQEQNQPSLNFIDDIIGEEAHLSFMALTVRLLDHTATLKFQPNKGGKKTHLTLIVSKLTAEHIKLARFLNK